MTRQTLGMAVLGLAMLALAACDPPDGRDLSVTIESPPSSIEVGDSVTFDAALANVGSAPASSASVSVLVPPGVSADVSGADLGCAAPAYLQDTDQVAVVCQLGTLAPAEQIDLEVTLSSEVTGLSGDVSVQAGSTGGREPSGGGAPNAVTFPFAVTAPGFVDLAVKAPGFEIPPHYDATTESRTEILNRGTLPTSPVAVTQEYPTGFTLLSADLLRSDGAAEGTCSIVGQMATCTTGAQPVEPFTHPGAAWEMVVAVVPTSGTYYEIVHTASSPAPEPDPDPSPNTATRTGFRNLAYLELDAPETVAAGTSFDVPIHWIGGGFGQYVSGSIPPNLRLDGISAGFFGTLDCGSTGAISCFAFGPFIGENPGGVGDPVLHLTALEPGGPGAISLFISSEGGSAGGSAQIETIDPSITSDVHPTLTAPAFGLIGEQVTLAGEVRTAGATPHDDVSATLEVPPGSVINRATWGAQDIPCAITGPAATCEIGDMDGYDQQPIELVLTSIVPGTAEIDLTITSATAQDAPDPWPDAISVEVPIRAPFTDLGLTATQAPDPPTQGTTHETVFTVTNQGSDPATGATLSVEVPDGYGIFSVSNLAPVVPGTSCATAGQVVTCTIGTLNGGASQQVRVRATTGLPGPATYSAAVVGDQAEPVPDEHANAATIAVDALAPNANLGVEFTSTSVLPVIVGTQVSLPVRVTNAGPSPVTAASAEIAAPDGWQLNSVGGAADGCAVIDNKATCGPRSLNLTTPSTPWTFSVRATPLVAGSGADFTVTVSSELPDLEPSSNTAMIAVDSLPNEVDLGFVVSGWQLFGQGGTGMHTVRVTNLGPAAATGVVLTGTLPDEATIVSASGGGFACTWGDHDLACTRAGSILPGSTGNVTLSLTYADVPGPLQYDFAVSSAVQEAEPEVLPNDVQITVVSAQAPRGFSGTVVGPGGEPVAGAKVSAYAEADGVLASGFVNTAADGTWRLSTLQPGTYRIRVVPPAASGLATEWYLDQPTRALASPLTIDATTPHHELGIQVG